MSNRCTQKHVWCAELLRWGFRAYGIGQSLVILWYWKSGHVRDVAVESWNAPSFSLLREHVNERGWQMLSKSQERRSSGTAPDTAVDERFKNKWPNLWDYLTQTKWDDGTPRETSSLLVFAGDGRLKGMLKDRDASLTLWVAADTFERLLDLLEKACVDPDAEWRQDRPQGQPGATASRKGKK